MMQGPTVKSLGRIAGRRQIRPIVGATRTYTKTTTTTTTTTKPNAQINGFQFSKNAAVVTTLLFGGALLYHQKTAPKIYAELPPKVRDLPKDIAKFEISSQHDQVHQFWERPGVYLWGANRYRVAAPESKDEFIKSPRRFNFFDGYVLKDLKLGRTVGVAVTEDGEVLQWGTGYSEDCTQPEPTLKGKNIIKVSLSRDRIMALSKSGEVYAMPISKKDQLSFKKPLEASSSWLPMGAVESPISYRIVSPKLTSWEKIIDIDTGLEHCVMLTSAGRVFTSAAATSKFPDKNQLGVPGITWTKRPKGPFDMPHELTSLKGFHIQQIAAGDTHTILLDKDGRLFSFGDNSTGQLGFDYASEPIEVPSLVGMRSFYKDNVIAKCVSIAAGGRNSYFIMEAQDRKNPHRDIALTDVFSCGTGASGGLGTGRWSHAQNKPQRIPTLSGLSEYSDTLRRVVPITFSYLTVGQTHTAVVMSNLTNVTASAKDNDVNYGADILFFGGNEFYQLGTGKRNNLPSPTYIPPLEASLSQKLGRREDHRLQVVPPHKVQITDHNGKRRKMRIEQRVVAGDGLTGCYASLC